MCLGVPEKTKTWPVGHTKPFKPNSRFEVIDWVYFDKDNMYGITDESPISNYTHAYRQDYDEIMTLVSKTLHIPVKKLEMVDGYRRLDPRRGEEIILITNVSLLVLLCLETLDGN